MTKKQEIKFFEERRVRSVWDDATNEWYFSVVDVVEALTDSADPKQYIKKMRKRDPELDVRWGTICTLTQLVANDGKEYNTTVATSEGLLRIIQSIPSTKKDEFKRWLEQETAHKISDSQIVIYQSKDGQAIDVRINEDTVWLNPTQMSVLFGRSSKTIRKHIDNALKEELAGEVVVAKFETTTQHGAMESKTQSHETLFYNLDVIISVGYRVKSKNGVAFRRWTTKVLKDYLVKGYVINNNIAQQRYEELKQLVQVMGRTLDLQNNLTLPEAQDVISIVTDYTYALDTLDSYDYQQLEIESTTPEANFHATYENAMAMIQLLKEKFGGSRLFAKEKDESFRSSIGQIYQTFGGNELYPSVEEKAAMLLYLVVKNHSFIDGNKRIAATLFLWFMQQNGILYHKDGTKRISDGTLVALTLLIAESRAEEKDVMVKVVVNLINQKN